MQPQSFVAIALVAGAVTSVGSADARGVRVRAEARIDAYAKPVEGAPWVEVEARAKDEDGAALGGVWLEVATRGARSAPCSGSRSPMVTEAGMLRVQTSSEGWACARLETAEARGSYVVRFSGDSLHGGAESAVSFDRNAPRQAPMELRPAIPRIEVEIGAPRLPLTGLLLRSPGQPPGQTGLRVRVLADDRREVAVASAGADGRFVVELSPGAFRGPGIHLLNLEFDGDEERSPASARVEIGVRSRATLSIANPPSEVAAGDEVILEADVNHERGTVDDGLVEVSFGGIALASAPVRQGKARVLVPTEPRSRGIASWSVGYIPSSRHLIAGPPQVLHVTLNPPGFGSMVWFVGLVVAGAVWLSLSWRRSRTVLPTTSASLPLEPGVHISTDSGTPGRFEGRVLDAHERRPLADVEILVRTPSLRDEGVVLVVRSSEDGAFAFELGEAASGANACFVEARSATHSSERRALPRSGRLTIALVTRRRALLDRLVRWSRRAGPPFDQVVEPTPADVLARSRERDDVASWALAVERAAFGPQAVDEEMDERVRGEEPR